MDEDDVTPEPAQGNVVLTISMSMATYELLRERLDELVTEFDLKPQVWRD